MRRFHIVSMRSETSVADVGRQKVLSQLRAALVGTNWDANWLRFNRPDRRWLAIGRGVVRWIGAALRGRVLPLQSCLALQGEFEIPEASAISPDSDPVVYIDGVRLSHLGVPLKRQLGARLIVDFDDLMSRRVSRMRKRKETFSSGAFRDFFPAFAEPALAKGRPILNLLYYAEKCLLRRSEIWASREADAIVFASPFEARLFERFLRRYAPPPASLQLLVLGPCVRDTAQVKSIFQASEPDLRFVFIGSDTFEQNRVAVNEIIQLAEAGSLAVSTFIGGRMVGHYPPAPGVTFCGYIESLKDFYRPGSILLVPKSVRGGLKTKTFEAFDYGVPIIGSYEALEGFEGHYPWRLRPDDLRALVGNAHALRAGYSDALAAGMEICSEQYSFRIFRQRLLGFLNGRDSQALGARTA